MGYLCSQAAAEKARHVRAQGELRGLQTELQEAQQARFSASAKLGELQEKLDAAQHEREAAVALARQADAEQVSRMAAEVRELEAQMEEARQLRGPTLKAVVEHANAEKVRLMLMEASAQSNAVAW